MYLWKDICFQSLFGFQRHAHGLFHGVDFLLLCLLDYLIRLFVLGVAPASPPISGFHKPLSPMFLDQDSYVGPQLLLQFVEVDLIEPDAFPAKFCHNLSGDKVASHESLNFRRLLIFVQLHDV